MPWTSTDVDTLKAAIAAGKGARSLTFADQSVTFHSVDDMLKLLAVMQQEVTAEAGTSQRTRFAATSKGV